jgi:hypothetical protein
MAEAAVLSEKEASAAGESIQFSEVVAINPEPFREPATTQRFLK